MNRGRRGFTLVELLVVTVLGSLVVLASLQVLVTNQRAYTAQNAQIRDQQTIRAAMDVLWGELREVSSRGGDILSMGQDSISVRVMRKFGLTCAVDTTGTGQPRLRATRVGPAFESGDSAWVFADNDEDVENDDRWFRARVTQVDTTALCGTTGGQILVFAGQRPAFHADSVRVGAPVRSFRIYTYRPVLWNGELYLGRTEPGSNAIPIVGPLAPSGGLAFSYRDSIGGVTTVPTRVRQIVITVRTRSGVLNSLGQPVSDSITTWIYTRN